MEFIISFFRDVLDGWIYIAVVIICSILIAACIGYLGEIYLDNKKKKEFVKKTYVQINNKVK